MPPASPVVGREVAAHDVVVRLGVGVAEGDPVDPGEELVDQQRRDHLGDGEHQKLQPAAPPEEKEQRRRAEEREEVVGGEQHPQPQPGEQRRPPAHERFHPPEQDHAEERGGDDRRVRVGEASPVDPPRVGDEERQEGDGNVAAVSALQENPENGDRGPREEDVGDQPAAAEAEELHERIGEQGIEEAAEHHAELPLVARRAVEHQERRLEVEVVDVHQVAAGAVDVRVLEGGRAGGQGPRAHPDLERQQQGCAGHQEEVPPADQGVSEVGLAKRSRTT